MGARARAIIRASTLRATRTPLDIIFLLERLESLVATGTGVPATRKVIVDRDAVLDLIDQLRVAIPEEVTAAKRINAEGERIIEQAQQEGERAVARAQEQAAFMIGERGLTEAAEAEGRRIIAEAESAAEGVRQGADDYARQILESLEDEMRRALDGITKGIAVLDDRRAELRGGDEAGEASGDGGQNGRDWADVNESPAFLREGDAGGQAVGR